MFFSSFLGKYCLKQENLKLYELLNILFKARQKRDKEHNGKIRLKILCL